MFLGEAFGTGLTAVLAEELVAHHERQTLPADKTGQCKDIHRTAKIRSRVTLEAWSSVSVPITLW